MTDTIDQDYTKDQIKRAKELAEIIFGEEINTPDFRKSTTWGVKTNTGIINLILNIMFGGGR